MRDIKKLMELIKNEPNKTNEYILNSSGTVKGMSPEEVKLEDRSLTVIRKLDEKSIDMLYRSIVG